MTIFHDFACFCIFGVVYPYISYIIFHSFLDAIASLGVGLSVTKIVKKSDGLKILND